MYGGDRLRGLKNEELTRDHSDVTATNGIDVSFATGVPREPGIHAVADCSWGAPSELVRMHDHVHDEPRHHRALRECVWGSVIAHGTNSEEG